MREIVPLSLLGRSANLPSLVDNSTKGSCAKCGAKVWVTPSMQTFLDKRKAKLLCGSCYPRPKLVS